MRPDIGAAESRTGIGRLTKRREFKAAAQGRRAHSELMTLQAAPRGESDLGPRIGLTVTRKEGSAVERNRIRRRLRAATHALDHALPRPDHDYVIIARRALLGAPFSRVVADLDAAFVRVHTGRGTRPGGRHRPDIQPAKV